VVAPGWGVPEGVKSDLRLTRVGAYLPDGSLGQSWAARITGGETTPTKPLKSPALAAERGAAAVSIQSRVARAL
jgi:hypothetical protein